MPYIVTTKSRPDLPSTVPSRGLTGEPNYTVSRRAVATLDEAREAASEAVQRMVETYVAPDGLGLVAEGQEPFFSATLNLPVQGGTLTLPDGTLIEVERVSYLMLWDALTDRPTIPVDGPEGDEGRAGILDQYNAAQ